MKCHGTVAGALRSEEEASFLNVVSVIVPMSCLWPTLQAHELGTLQWDAEVLLASNESLPFAHAYFRCGVGFGSDGGLCGLARRRYVVAFSERVAGRSFLCCLRAGLCAMLDLAAVPYSPERFCGTAGFTVFVKRAALTEEKRRPFLDPETPCFFTPLPRKDKLLGARSVVGSVTTRESLVLYVFAVFGVELWSRI